ncbi:hypothetical protein I4U23_012652 [Adineta vaga]|nr:hypothetical protein I4U23_012652 [Adineta vaga]
MRLKDIFHWSCQYIQNYNLFIPDDDYDEETDENERSETTLIRQKYTTWVYVVLLLVCVCVLIQTALMQFQSRTITISPVTPLIFEQLYIKHEKTLSCPCLKVTVPYRDFVLNKIRFHDVCSSQFISDEWIEAVYTKDESRYGTTDFRTTANSQFYLLARLCSFSKDTVRQNQLNFDNNEFVTIKVLSSHQVEVETKAIFNSMKKSISIQIMSFFNYLRTTSQANSQVSALNTNTDDRSEDSIRQQKIYTRVYLFLLATNKTSNDAIDRFLLEFFLYQSTIAYFGLLVKAVHLFIQIDLPFVKLEQDYMNYFDQNLIVDIEIDEIFQNQLAQIKFRLIGTRDIHSMRINCICAVNPSCESSSVIYNDTLSFNDGNTQSIRYIIPGLVTGCSRMDSLLRSTLQCFYTDSNCTSIIIANLVTFDGWYHDLDSWSEKYALLYDPKRSRFPPNTSIETIVRKLMIEEWNHSFLYEKFYESCAPIHCTYKEKVRTKTTIDIITTLLSMIGGLTVSLYVITPYVVKVVSRLLRLIHRRERHSEQQEQVRPRWFDRLKMVLWDMISFLYNNVIDLNLFRRRDFGSNVHRTTTMHLGQWATRLYILLFLISLVVISIYNAVQPRTITKTFPKPTVTLYKQLREKYKDKLECSCGSIATTYDRFIEIKAVFHEICRSPFTSDAWRINLTHNLDPSLAIYARRDYRRFLSAHLQYLSGLCDLSIELVTSSMDQFRRSLFITTQLLSEEDFRATINLTIEQRKSVAPMTFARVFFLIRSANHGNAFVSTYETNFRYILPWEDIYGTYAPTEAMIYDNECSCGKHPNCTTEARFLDTKTNMSVSIKGLKIGCTPSESFHLSTLECFYEQSCIDLIQKHVDHIVDNSSAKSAYILSERMIHFLVNSTINELIDDLFVDEWMIQLDYMNTDKDE